MFVKLKPCTCANRSWRRFLAKPAAAMAAYLPARNPHTSETSAHSSRIRPNLRMAGMLPPVMPSSISVAMTVGMAISRMPRPARTRGPAGWMSCIRAGFCPASGGYASDAPATGPRPAATSSSTAAVVAVISFPFLPVLMMSMRLRRPRSVCRRSPAHPRAPPASRIPSRPCRWPQDCVSYGPASRAAAIPPHCSSRPAAPVPYARRCPATPRRWARALSVRTILRSPGVIVHRPALDQALLLIRPSTRDAVIG